MSDLPTGHPLSVAEEPARRLSAGALGLEAVLSARPVGRRESRGWLDVFLNEPDPLWALVLWTGPEARALSRDPRALSCRLSRDIAAIDGLISRQVNVILHHPQFQRLEASWRGLHYLANQGELNESIKLQVLNVTWQELARDAERALEFDQSQLFRKIYSDEFDMPGGEPFGVLVGDYEIRHRPGPDHGVDDVAVLRHVAQVAAAAFTPFIASADPALLGLERFSHLERAIELKQLFSQEEHLKWRAFRDMDEARFVGLTLPRVLMRLPYEDTALRRDGFRFREDVAAEDNSEYLWGSAAWAFAGVLIRAFSESGWFGEIRGVRAGEMGHGLVADLPVQSFRTDKEGVAVKPPTDLIVTDALERDLSGHGLVPLCWCKDTPFCAFYSMNSSQSPKTYKEPAATANSRISAMLPYVFCASRFAHYLKVLARQKIGAFIEVGELQTSLHNWIHKYVTPDVRSPMEIKARFPLREAQVRVREIPEKPGVFLCVIQLWPHFQLEELTANIRLATELRAAAV